MTVKTLVVCIDGTWNTPGQHDRDPVTGHAVETRTNVALTWEALTGERLHPSRPYGSMAALKAQPGMALYLSGIGHAGSRLTRYLQGATGRGLAMRVRDAYRFLSERWRPGDRIVGFGFSRGAFAVRSLMGFIEAVGLPRSNNLIKERELARLYAQYRRSHGRPLARPEWTIETPVQFLGLWDTVGALAFGRLLNGYHRLSPGNVAHVCHAIALDEERNLFHPVPWEARPGSPQVVEEVLFAGAHTNVGGGYCDSRLSAIPLIWILGKAQVCGLAIDLAGIEPAPESIAVASCRPSYVEFWNNCRWLGRLVVHLDLGRRGRPVGAGQRLHESVREAIRRGAYRPAAQGLERLLAA